MSNQEPDGWATTSPEGEYTGNDDEIILTRVDCELVEDGYRTFPVCLIDPQELTRLRLIEEWAKEMCNRLNRISLRFQSPIDSVHAEMLCEQYRAITEAKP